PKSVPEPLTAEGEAEKPTRKPPARKGGAAVAKESEPAEAEEPVVAEEPDAEEEPEAEAEATPEAEGATDEAPEVVAEPGGASAGPPQAPAAKKKTRRGSRGGRSRKKKPAAASQNGGEAQAVPEVLTEPGRASAASPATLAAEAPSDERPDEQPGSEDGDFEYVPMSEWADEIES